MTLSPASLDTRRLVSKCWRPPSAARETGQQQSKRERRNPCHLPGPRINRLLTSAIHDAFTLTGSPKANVLAAIIRASALVAPQRIGWLAAEAETTARSIHDVSERNAALVEVAVAVAAADPERAKALARSIDDAPWQGDALAKVAKVVAAADPEYGEAIARSIDDAVSRPTGPVVVLSREDALTGVAGVVAATDPERG